MQPMPAPLRPARAPRAPIHRGNRWTRWTRSTRGRLLGGLLALLAPTASCAWDVSPPGVYFASEPPGARILVDGLDSGYVTPRMIALNREERYRVSFEMSGFHPQQVILVPNRAGRWIAWDEGTVSMHGLFFPLFLSLEDLVVPRRVKEVHAPSRIFVRMDPRQE